MSFRVSNFESIGVSLTRSISYTHPSLAFLFNIIGDKQKKHHDYLFRVTLVWLEMRHPVRQTYDAVLAQNQIGSHYTS